MDEKSGKAQARRTRLPLRRTILIRAGLLGAVVVAPSFLGTASAQAKKAKKTAVKYQDKPNGAQMCAGCMHFIPAKAGKGPGACKIIEGAISPSGWCAEWETPPNKKPV